MLISGSGSNLQAILDARANDSRFPAEPVLVVSDRPDAAGLSRASEAGISTQVVDWVDYPDRESFTKVICDVLDDHLVELVVLAGFMRVLSEEAIRRFPNAILNIHPALLPAFPGARAVEEALAYGVKTTGVTVHFVDEHVDGGPIVAQEPVAVMAADSVASLHARIQTIEHRLYPKCVAAAAAGRLRVQGRTVIWDER